ncbi:hypothetical protein C1I98_23235 [Spongiactinospora gelatinilytica]|uniref:PA14 domain-containing protein n=1 Tax=Spongiactinospora gelatinilytica TaxID=2666298 RepID=A0A2W2FQV7_9ACTN|nr:PA14 domain-containing protein [Spongiactinospora gelatinilytica]PZG39776.1 hypothetical protein C1I98_23235 [Spongiactinospora gelatinilytica]
MTALRRTSSVLLALLLAFAWQSVPTASSDRADRADAAERNGLRGDYYLSSGAGRFDFAEHKATIVDPAIEPADLNPVFKLLTGREDDVTVRWTGRIAPKYSETYTFSMVGDNGYRLWIDGRPVIDHWVDDWDREQVGVPIALQAGRKYDIKIEYFEHYGGANLRLRWQSPSQAKEIVPVGALFLPEGHDPPGPESAAVGASGTSVTLDFAEDLAALPAGAHDKLVVMVSGTAWPARSARLRRGDPSVVELTLAHAVPKQAGDNVRASYDGRGGITLAGGDPLPKYDLAAVVNGSDHTIRTRWAKDVDRYDPLPEYPRPQLARSSWRSLNGVWQFAAAGPGEAPPFGRDLAERIVVPYPVESLLSGLQRHEERMFYRRTFTVPRDWKVRGKSGDRLLLHLDAVDWESIVYVNGKQVGTHKGGYDRFTVDVTDALRRHGAQELVVAVYDPTDQGRQPLGKQRLNPGGIMYTPASGIWQPVWMEPVPRTRVESPATVPDVPGQALKVTVDGTPGATAVVTARAGRRVVGRVSGPTGAELAYCCSASSRA